MIKQLQRKFIAISMVSLLIVMSAVLGAINAANIHNMVQRADGLLQILADNDGRFPRQPQGPGAAGTRRQPEGGRPEAAARRGGIHYTEETPFETRYFTVRAAAGSIIEADISHIAAVTEAEARGYAEELLASGKSGGFKGEYRYLAVQQENGALLVFVDCHMQLDTVKNFFWNSCGIALASMVIVLILISILSKRAIRPVIDNMEKQKRFITDAGHEIKTPLAIISANNDVIEIVNGKSEWTSSIHNQVERLNGLVKNLLTLAKLEEGGQKRGSSIFPLSSTVEETAWAFIPLAEKRGLQIEAQVHPDISMKGDEAAMAHLTAILMDNAVKYADEGGTITVKLWRRGRGACLEVSNPCEGMPEGDLSRLFDRFYREEESRTRESGGYGIGLSVARAIVEAHGGKISAKKDGGGQISFFAEFYKDLEFK